MASAEVARVGRLVASALAIAALATWAAGRIGDPGARRLFLVVGLPIVLVAAAALVVGATASPIPIESSPARRFRLAVVATLLFGADFAAVPLGYAYDWLTFTYGDQTLAATRGWLPAVALPISFALGIWAWERVLRGRIYEAWARRSGPLVASIGSTLVGVALAVPAIAPGLRVDEPGFVATALAVAVAREATCLALYRGGGILAAGLFRGLVTMVESVMLGDWASPLFAGANYVVADPRFYGARVATAVVAAGVAWAALLRRSAR